MRKFNSLRVRDITQEFRLRTAPHFFLDRGHGAEDTVFLFGSGRSGTTWLSQLINARSVFRYLFEPYHPERVPDIQSFGWRKYLRPKDDYPEFLEKTRSVLCGEISSPWINQFNPAFLPKRRLVKEIRAHLFAKWLHVNFPETRLVLIIRNPVDVALSAQRLCWQPQLDEILSQEQLVEDHLSGLPEQIFRAGNDFEKFFLCWCLEHFVLLRQFSNSDQLYVVCYEELLRAPSHVLKDLYKYLELEFSSSVLDEIRVPSQMTGGGSITQKNIRSRLDLMVDSFETLKVFSLDHLYDQNGDHCFSSGLYPFEKFG